MFELIRLYNINSYSFNVRAIYSRYINPCINDYIKCGYIKYSYAKHIRFTSDYLKHCYLKYNCLKVTPTGVNHHIKRQRKAIAYNEQNHSYCHQQRGFSLIEVTIVVAILSILLSVSIPNFSSMINKSKLSSVSMELTNSLSLARQYAITNNNKVHLCALSSVEPTVCKKERDFNANWSQGWMTFADTNDDNEYDPGDTVLRISSAPQTVNVVFNQRGRLRFFPDGSARSAGFYICNQNSTNNRHIKLLYSGRARTSKINNPSQVATCLTAN